MKKDSLKIKISITSDRYRFQTQFRNTVNNLLTLDLMGHTLIKNKLLFYLHAPRASLVSLYFSVHPSRCGDLDVRTARSTFCLPNFLFPILPFLNYCSLLKNASMQIKYTLI